MESLDAKGPVFYISIYAAVSTTNLRHTTSLIYDSLDRWYQYVWTLISMRIAVLIIYNLGLIIATLRFFVLCESISVCYAIDRANLLYTRSRWNPCVSHSA